MPEPPSLPSAGFYDRLTNAIEAWQRREQRVGLGGTQAALAKALHPFGAAAPVGATIGKWFRRESLPGLDHCFMLAHALGVRPAWLAFDDGPMLETATAERLARAHPAAIQSGRAVQDRARRKRRTG